MSVVTVPTGWIRRRVFVNGYGPSYTVQLTEPLYNVMFAVCLSMDSSANILTINGLNQSRATTIDASGNVYNYNYFARNSTVMRSESLVFARHQNGIDIPNPYLIPCIKLTPIVASGICFKLVSILSGYAFTQTSGLNSILSA